MNNPVYSAVDFFEIPIVTWQQGEHEMSEKNAPEVHYGGEQLVIPKGMTSDDAIKWITLSKKQREEFTSVDYTTSYSPMDGAYALLRAFKERYGWTNLIPTETLFGPQPPRMIAMETYPGHTEQVPWGNLGSPALEDGYLTTGFKHTEDGRCVFKLGGKVKQKNKDEVDAIIELMTKYLREDSIYRGKAIRIRFAEDSNYDPTLWIPKFIDVAGIAEEELILSHDVHRLINATLWTPITKIQKVRAAGVPLKRGVLLEGPFGTGKTLTALVTAKKCVENGWTYIYLEDVRSLPQALYFAEDYAPAVIFAEDIDKVLEGDRSEDMNEILNVIDGINTKDKDIMAIFTTNSVEKINQAMMRPGRLDTVVTVSPPDASAVERLIRQYSRAMLSLNAYLNRISERLSGQIPATIREVVERSKLMAIADDRDLITEDDMLDVIGNMEHHLHLLTQKRSAGNMTPDETLGYAIGQGVVIGMEKYAKQMEKINEAIREISKLHERE